MVQQVVVWFDCFYPDTQGCCGSLCTVYIQNRLSCGVAFFVRQCSRKWLPVPLPTRHPTYDTIVAASLAQCTAVAAKKENVIVLKNNASTTCPPSGRAPLTPLPGNAHDIWPVFCPYFCYWPAAARHPGFQPLSPPSNLPSPPIQLVPRRTLRSAGGDLVRLFLPRHPRLLWFSQYSLHTKPSVLWRSPLLLSVTLALVFMPGLYSTAYRATFPAFLCGCL